MWLAFLVNLTAFPLTSGLLPYVARDVYRSDETGLGMLVACFSFGSLLGSIAVSLAGRSLRPARMMILFALGWYAALLLFVQMPNPVSGRMALVIAGFTQSLSLVPMSVLLLHSAGERFRGRVMGVRMLAIYGVPIGLLAAGGADRPSRLRGDGLALLPGRRRADPLDRAALAGRSVADRGAGQHALIARSGRPLP